VSLSDGTKLGSYEITAQIGAGGMGEVYRATDSKLGRDVAIKTLPAALASDKDRLARFEREAKLLAALNHPHIASVYSLDEHEGTLYLAMELIEGETLEEKLKLGSLPVEDALRLALQIAEALEAAHGNGVVHRDLKPANVMVTPDGIIKVLDFGLAKAFSEGPTDSNLAQSPALSVAMTQQGLVLGTAGYMSPEQASGQPTDQRADIWSFGVVLYEMLTGLPLFSGESVPHILADVLKTEPDWNKLPDRLHPRLKLMLERCLTKKPKNRYHAIADARVDIQEVLSDPAGPLLASVVPEGAPAASRARRASVAASLLVVGAAVASVAVWFAMVPESTSPPVRRFDYDIPEGMGFRFPSRPLLALSPDGDRFVLNLDGDLYLRPMRELEANRIDIPDRDIGSPFFSPDGQTIAYNVPTRFLHRISISGGAALPLTELSDFLMGAVWAEDGRIYYGQPDGIYRVAAGGGDAQIVIQADEGERLYPSQLLPDGDSVLFSADKTGNWDMAEIVVGSISTGERAIVHRGGSDARYLPTGHLIYAFENRLFGVALDPASLTVSGAPAELQADLVRANGTASANYGISEDGTLVYLTGVSFGGGEGDINLVWVDRSGSETETGMRPCSCSAGDNNLALAPDGTRAALVVTNSDNDDSDIWVWSFAAETLTQLTFEPGNQFRPVWALDSGRIVYGSADDGIAARAADGTGSVEMLLADSPASEPWSLDVDGNVLFRVSDDIHALNVADGTELPLLAEAYEEAQPAVSPDGRFIAYRSDESGRNEVYVKPYPDTDSGQWRVSVGGGFYPRWSADGSRLYFVSPSGGAITASVLMEAVVETEPSFSNQTPVALFPFTSAGYRAYDVSGDGERFLMLKVGAADDADASAAEPRVIIVENWFEELKRLVPTD
jgi:serine/threonine protein kinase/Tol biopolymer transport system component